VLHVTSAEIIPSSTYEIRAYPVSCRDAENECALASAPLTVRTQRWGDIVAPFQPDGTGQRTQPNAVDIAAGVDKVRAVSGSIGMPRAQLQPQVIESPYGVSALDIAAVIDAVRGLPYPFGEPCLCPTQTPCPIVDPCGRCDP
jgi:hypothetical protein